MRAPLVRVLRGAHRTAITGPTSEKTSLTISSVVSKEMLPTNTGTTPRRPMREELGLGPSQCVKLRNEAVSVGLS